MARFFRRIYFVSRETLLVSKISIILIFFTMLGNICLSRGEAKVGWAFEKD